MLRRSHGLDLGVGAFALLVALAGLTVVQLRCANISCLRNSDCGDRAACVNNGCVSQCQQDRDCRGGQFCDLNGRCMTGVSDATDARTDGVAPDGPRDVPGSDIVSQDTPTPMDVPMPPVDVPLPPVDVPTPIDVPVPVDVPTTGTGRYLDPCASDRDCASALCSARGTPFCTRVCMSSAECADGQICAAGRCEIDDIGRPSCDLSSGAPCLEFCYGTPSTRHCTHACSTANDCPAGYACSAVGGRRICVDIERPCSTPTACPSGLGFCAPGGAGCTAPCATDTDCPNRLVGLPAYRCMNVSGQNVCVPPADIMGSDPLGAICSATGINRCRSGACDDGTMPPTCAQRCTVRGGCPTGYGCYPLPEATDVLLVCNVAGTAWLGEPCARARDCASALCTTERYCTRMCNDGFCPTGMSCMPTGLVATDGTMIRLCRR